MATIKEVFDKRKEYDESNPNFEYPEKGKVYTKYYIDTWKVSPFYGKVDTLGIPVIPKQSKLRYCTYGTDAEQYFALQPVMNFFSPLRQQYEKFYLAGAINKNSKYFKKDLAPTRALVNSNIEFQQIIQNRYRNFVDYLLSNNKFNSITNYNDFLQELLIYIKVKNSYFTRAGYVESYDYSLLHTGLAIDIYREDGSNDDERLAFFNDVNSDSFLELCIRSNMKIDREIPWRVFVDIRTKPIPSDIILTDTVNLNFQTVIKEYIPDFNNNIQKFFDTFYDRVIPYDNNSYPYFEEFVIILQSYYKSFSNSYPIYKKYSINNCGKSEVLKLNRDILEENAVSYDRAKYVDLYLKFRNAELSKVVPEDKLLHILSVSNEIYNSQNKIKSSKEAILSAIKYYTDNIGTLAYRNPSLYELDEEYKMS